MDSLQPESGTLAAPTVEDAIESGTQIEALVTAPVPCVAENPENLEQNTQRASTTTAGGPLVPDKGNSLRRGTNHVRIE